MKRYLLDSSALLTLRDDEPGADRVAELLEQSGRGKVQCLGSFMSLTEILYRVWRDESEEEGRLAYEQCLALPVQWLYETRDLLLQAAELKARHALSLADAWIAASAMGHAAVLVHKDPEYGPLALPQELLPLKPRKT